MKTILTIFAILLTAGNYSFAQNTLINGSAEYYDTTTLVPENWVIISGNWKSADHTPYTADAHDSTHIFYEGNDAEGILQQDVNVTGYAAQIDASNLSFLFSGWVQSHSEAAAPADQAAVVVQCLDAGKTQVLYSWKSDTIFSVGTWTQMLKQFMPPVGTRHVRVQLIALRNQGTSNDAYFDDLNLVPGAPTAVAAIVNNDVFTITPNPASSTLHITLKSPGHYHINIIGADGKIVLATRLTETADIDISGLPPATYALQVFSENGVSFQTERFIKR